MRHRLLARLRVMTMLVAFGLGLAGQSVATVAMMAMPQDGGSTIAVSAGGMEHCPDCAGNGDTSGNASKGLMPNCIAGAFCSISVTPAIAAQFGMAFPPRESVRFAIISGDTVRGLSIPPDLGPPRTIHRS